MNYVVTHLWFSFSKMTHESAPLCFSPVLPTLDGAHTILGQDTWLLSFSALVFLVSCSCIAAEALEGFGSDDEMKTPGMCCPLPCRPQGTPAVGDLVRGEQVV